MSNHPASRTVTDLETMIQEMQYLVEHPRIQQKTWVAKGKSWLPTLQHAKNDLVSETNHYDFAVESYQSILDTLRFLGLEIRQRDSTTWCYSWYNATPIGAYPSPAKAIEAALVKKLAGS